MEQQPNNWTGQRQLAEACWSQARANYAAAVTLLDAGVYFASVFFAQQAAEMALKAASIRKLHKIPRGHNLINMCSGLEAPAEVMNASAELNPQFLSTRSPEAATGVPAQNYDRKSARLHLRMAQTIVDWIKATLY
ncbi:MAG: HEPN domain-containing protein [Armatimonadetes bacterium]|nr:HEPN domain-containing protein [Armatimonadota bacterium]